MKIKSIILIFLITVGCSIISCVPENTEPLERNFHTRLLRKCLLDNVQDTLSNCCDYYTYDSLNRIDKIWTCIQNLNDSSQSGSFYLLRYNNVNRLQYKLSYIYDRGILWDSTCYFYINDLLIREESYNFNSKSSFIYTYEYEDNFLLRKCYIKASTKKWFLYEYKGSLCFKELECTDSLGGSILFYTLHFYLKGLKIRSEWYSSDNNSLGQIINYTYNSDGQLVLEEAITNPDWVAPGDHVYRYDYEKAPE